MLFLKPIQMHDCSNFCLFAKKLSIVLVCEPWLFALGDLLHSWLRGEREAETKQRIWLLTTTVQAHLRDPSLWESIWRAGPAVAEVWYDIRLTLCTSLRVCRIRQAAKGHASVGPDRKSVLLVSLSHFPFSLFHFYCFPSYRFFFTLASSLSHLAVPAEVNIPTTPL